MEWISVRDKMPEDCGDVPIWIDTDQGYWVLGFWEEGRWFTENGEPIKAERITHWMDIKPPKQ